MVKLSECTMAKEYDIPGWPQYTVDEDMKVYSYKSGQKKLMKTHKVDNTDCLALRNKGRHVSFSVQRLLFFSRRGINPDSSAAKKLRIYKNEEILDPNYHMEEARRIKEERRGSKKDCDAADTAKKVRERIKMLKYAIDLQYDAIKKNDGTELFNFLLGQLDNVLEYVHHYTIYRKHDIKEAWMDACIKKTQDVISSHYIIGDIVRTTLKVAENLRRKEINKSKRTLDLIENYNYE